MTRVICGVVVSVALLWGGPVSAETPSFDPDQPFRQAFSSQQLRAFLNQALDLLEDHVEVSAELPRSGDGDRHGRFALKLYPQGKSRSPEHWKAEGWFDLAPEAGRQDFHLRLEQPENSRRSLQEPQPIL